jgi:hypothetical protein
MLTRLGPCGEESPHFSLNATGGPLRPRAFKKCDTRSFERMRECAPIAESRGFYFILFLDFSMHFLLVSLHMHAPTHTVSCRRVSSSSVACLFVSVSPRWISLHRRRVRAQTKPRDSICCIMRDLSASQQEHLSCYILS